MECVVGHLKKTPEYQFLEVASVVGKKPNHQDSFLAVAVEGCPYSIDDQSA
jgi:hypothetical protein